MQELLAQAAATLPDNTVGDISAADVRQMITDFIDSVSPGYGVIQLTTLAKATTATPSVLSPWTAVSNATATMFIGSAALGQVTRLIGTAGLAGATNFITLQGSVNGPNNSNVTLEIYKNGAPTGIKTSVTCTGSGDNVGINAAGLDYTASVDAVYEVRASSVPSNTHTFSNLALIVQAQPVRAY